MLKKDAINHFRSVAALAAALGISRSAVYQWREVVPESSSWKLQALTGGALRAGPAAVSVAESS